MFDFDSSIKSRYYLFWQLVKRTDSKIDDKLYDAVFNQIQLEDRGLMENFDIYFKIFSVIAGVLAAYHKYLMKQLEKKMDINDCSKQ